VQVCDNYVLLVSNLIVGWGSLKDIHLALASLCCALQEGHGLNSRVYYLQDETSSRARPFIHLDIIIILL